MAQCARQESTGHSPLRKLTPKWYQVHAPTASVFTNFNTGASFENIMSAGQALQESRHPQVEAWPSPKPALALRQRSLAPSYWLFEPQVPQAPRSA